MLKVMVEFPNEIPSDIQGKALLMFEQYLRERTMLPVQVLKELQCDDSKLRRLMTPEQRDRL